MYFDFVTDILKMSAKSHELWALQNFYLKYHEYHKSKVFIWTLCEHNQHHHIYRQDKLETN